jgi:amino acid permease
MLANYHVLFVHFPAALLPLYAVLELLRWKRFTEKPYWFYIKGILAILGMLSAHIASSFGDAIETMIGDKHPELKPTIEAHSGMAALTTLVFTVLGLAYLITWIEKENPNFYVRSGWRGALARWALAYAHFILRGSVSFILALIGLFAIVILCASSCAIIFVRGA